MLLVSFILALILRVFSLNSIPIGLNADEAAFGYNAYSLLKTGHDEWGTPAYQLPVSGLKSFGDFKLPLYSFMAVPTVKLLGLNEFSTRLPNAIFGSLSVFSIYLLAFKLFNRKVALISALMLAISPWGIQLSRGAFEANLIVFFLPLAIYAWLKQKYLLTSVLLALNFYSYHSARYLTPFVLLILYLYSKPKINLKNLLPLFLLIILILPGTYSLLTTGSSRASDVGIYSPTDNWKSVADRRFEARFQGLPDSVARLFSNKLVYVVSEFTRSYVTYLSPYFLFVRGASETSYGMISDVGVMYFVDALLLISSIVMIIRYPKKSHLLLLSLLFIMPIPAALAKGSGFAANRAITMLPFILIFTSAGFVYLLDRKGKFTKGTVALVVCGYLVSFLFFTEGYFFHSQRSLAQGMNFGVKEAVIRGYDLARGRPLMFSRNLSEPHIFVAFYLKLDPTRYQSDIQKYSDFSKAGFKFLDQLGYYSISGFEFGNLNFSSGSEEKLLIGRPEDFPGDYPQHFQIDYPNGKTAIKVSQLNSN